MLRDGDYDLVCEVDNRCYSWYSLDIGSSTARLRGKGSNLDSVLIRGGHILADYSKSICRFVVWGASRQWGKSRLPWRLRSGKLAPKYRSPPKFLGTSLCQAFTFNSPAVSRERLDRELVLTFFLIQEI